MVKESHLCFLISPWAPASPTTLYVRNEYILRAPVTRSLGFPGSVSNRSGLHYLLNIILIGR